MKRKTKNIIVIISIIIIGVCSFFTMNASKNSISSANTNINKHEDNGMPPAKPDEDNQSKLQTNQNDNKQEGASSNTDENNNQKPPAKPDEDNQSKSQTNQNDNKQEGASSNTNENNNLKPPTMPNESNGSNEQKGKPEQEAPDMSLENSKIEPSYYVLFGIEGFIISILLVYLIISVFNKTTIKETLNTPVKIILYIVLVIMLTIGITYLQSYLTNNVFTDNNQTKSIDMQMPGKDSTADITYTATKEVSSEETSSESYTSSKSDENVILVKDGGKLTIEGSTISKTSGDSSNTENSEFYGVNSGVLVTKNSTATIKNANISTNAKGSNAVFSTGENSKIYISDSTITTTAEGSARGLDATYSGYIEANNVTIKTLGQSCATLATDRGEGTVITKNSKLETNGTGSPVIYSTGNISIENTTGVANGSQMVVVEGKNTATVTNSTLSATGTGNRGDVDVCGIMIYQSMSGDANEGTGTFNSTNSTLTILDSSKYYKTAPLFFITNTDASINLENTKLVYGSNILLSSKGTNQWGKSGTNGGNVTLNAKNQELNGNIELDDISTLVMNLTKSSYKGTINGDNSAKSIDLKLDSTSKITLTGDSYVTSLEDSDTSYSNIDFNGYKLYVNGTAIN